MFFPTVTLLCYLLSTYCFIATVYPQKSLAKKSFCALLLTSVTLAVMPFLNETLYWLVGMAHFWAASLLLVAFALAIKAIRDRSNIALAVCLLLFFLNGTLLEQPCVFQGVIAFLMTLYFLSSRNKRGALIMGLCLLASTAAFVTVFISPATASRMGPMKDLPFLRHLIRALVVAVGFGAFTILKFFMKPVVYVFLLFLPSIAQSTPAFDEKLASRVRAWHIVFATALIAPLMQAITGWAIGVGQPGRGEGFLIWMMGTVWVLLWSFCYRGKLSRIQSPRLCSWRWGGLLLCLLISFNFLDLIGDSKTALLFESENIAREASITRQKTQGKGDIVIPSWEMRPNLLYFWDLEPWPEDYKNTFFAHVHGIKKVFVLPRALCQDDSALIRFMGGDPKPLEEIAERGDSNTQVTVGELYDSNRGRGYMEGVVKDDEEAVRWYTKAASLGNPLAYRRLVSRYLLGNRGGNGYLYALFYFLKWELSSFRL